MARRKAARCRKRRKPGSTLSTVLAPQALPRREALQLVHDPVSKPDLVAKVTRTLATMRRPGYDQAVRMLASGRLLEDVARMDAACLVICGEKDAITPPSMARRVEATCRARGADAATRLVLVPDAGHMVYLEATAAVARELQDFAATVDRLEVRSTGAPSD